MKRRRSAGHSERKTICPGAPPVLLISNSVWKSRYAADPSMIGKAVRVNGLPVTIIGVMPDGVKWPFNSEAWMPLAQLAPAFRQGGRAGP